MTYSLQVSITVLATGFATDFYSSDAEAAEAAELQARKALAGNASKKAAVTAVNARAADNRPTKDASAVSAGPTRQKLPSSLNSVPAGGKQQQQQQSIANAPANKQVRRPPVRNSFHILVVDRLS